MILIKGYETILQEKFYLSKIYQAIEGTSRWENISGKFDYLIDSINDPVTDLEDHKQELKDFKKFAKKNYDLHKNDISFEFAYKSFSELLEFFLNQKS